MYTPRRYPDLGSDRRIVDSCPTPWSARPDRFHAVPPTSRPVVGHRARHRRRRRRRHADRHRPDGCHLPPGRSTYEAEQSDLPVTFAVKLLVAGRRGPRAGGPRLPLGARLLHRRRRRGRRADPAHYPLRDLRRRRRFRAAARRHGARGPGRPDRRLHARRGRAGRPRPRRPARPDVVRPTVDRLPRPGDVDPATTTPPRDSATSPSWPPQITLDRLGADDAPRTANRSPRRCRWSRRG